MASVAVYDILFTPRSPVPAGGEALSAVVDVRGSSEVRLLLETREPDEALTWSVMFGPTHAGRLLPTASGGFGSSVQAIVVPTFGPRMLLAVRNSAALDMWVDGNYYFVKG